MDKPETQLDEPILEQNVIENDNTHHDDLSSLPTSSNSQSNSKSRSHLVTYVVVITIVVSLLAVLSVYYFVWVPSHSKLVSSSTASAGQGNAYTYSADIAMTSTTATPALVATTEVSIISSVKTDAAVKVTIANSNSGPATVTQAASNIPTLDVTIGIVQCILFKNRLIYRTHLVPFTMETGASVVIKDLNLPSEVTSLISQWRAIPYAPASTVSTIKYFVFVNYDTSKGLFALDVSADFKPIITKIVLTTSSSTTFIPNKTQVWMQGDGLSTNSLTSAPFDISTLINKGIYDMDQGLVKTLSSVLYIKTTTSNDSFQRQSYDLCMKIPASSVENNSGHFVFHDISTLQSYLLTYFK
jgi:hypothetical protein